MKYSMVSMGALATACAAFACFFVAPVTPAQATNISDMPHVMAADNLAAWRAATPTTCRGVRFGQVGASDSPRYIFQNEGIESNNAGKEDLCIPITVGAMPNNERGIITGYDSADWNNAQRTECPDVRFLRKGDDSVYWVFGDAAAVYNDLSRCTAVDITK